MFLNSLLWVWASGAKFIRTSVMFGRAEMYSSLLLVWDIDLHSYWLMWCSEITTIKGKKKIKSHNNNNKMFSRTACQQQVRKNTKCDNIWCSTITSCLNSNPLNNNSSNLNITVFCLWSIPNYLYILKLLSAKQTYMSQMLYAGQSDRENVPFFSDF